MTFWSPYLRNQTRLRTPSKNHPGVKRMSSRHVFQAAKGMRSNKKPRKKEKQNLAMCEVSTNISPPNQSNKLKIRFIEQTSCTTRYPYTSKLLQIPPEKVFSGTVGFQDPKAILSVSVCGCSWVVSPQRKYWSMKQGFLPILGLLTCRNKTMTLRIMGSQKLVVWRSQNSANQIQTPPLEGPIILREKNKIDIFIPWHKNQRTSKEPPRWAL